MLFTGFNRCCYPFQKFDSVDGELRLVQTLESNDGAIKWMKSASSQFRIEYINGRNYEPDFVVETTDAYLMIEPKRSTQMEQGDVEQKAKAAARWCCFANEHATKCGGKPWVYLLIPHDAIELSRSAAALRAEFQWREKG